MERGALIVVEGLDRAGKSTQCQRLCATLEKDGFTVKHMRFPNRATPIGKSIDAYLKGEATIDDHVIHLLFSANRWEAASQIKEDIAAGTTVVIDRYSYSGAVYSAAKDDPTLSLEWAWQMEAGLPSPDLCIFLDVAPDVAKERGGFGEEKYENAKMQRKVKNMFQQLFATPCGSVTQVVDAGKSLEVVEHEIGQLVKKCMRSGLLREPLQKLEAFHGTGMTCASSK
ncbi:Thymidylate kinase [Lambiella insularis]|nr:Thymidylate kinase [Lambiella insularis]